MEKTYDNIKIEREGGITFLVLNRPEKRNAMSPGLHYDVEDALTRLDDDPETKVLVLAGAGDAWCAGQDLKLYFRETANNPLERKRSNTASHHWRWEILREFRSRRSPWSMAIASAAPSPSSAPAISRSRRKTPHSASPKSTGGSFPAAS